MATDEDLMIQLQGGDETALAMLMDRYKAPVFGFLNKRVGPDDADDLFQETWIRVVRARNRFDPKRRFSTWLFQIANNLCRDLGRRRSVRRRALDEQLAQAEQQPRSQAPPPVGERQDVMRRLDSLPGRLREVLVLRYYQDLQEGEIAEVLGIPRGTVKSRLHAATRALREQAEEEASPA
ncbi:MAG: sigma-70 family RNA polymerase sigma factor [Myxococcota bacterium]|nr:sigma-70 family RNA polymerase sigma factor [Myxococcota bacterium]